MSGQVGAVSGLSLAHLGSGSPSCLFLGIVGLGTVYPQVAGVVSIGVRLGCGLEDKLRPGFGWSGGGAPTVRRGDEPAALPPNLSHPLSMMQTQQHSSTNPGTGPLAQPGSCRGSRLPLDTLHTQNPRQNLRALQTCSFRTGQPPTCPAPCPLSHETPEPLGPVPLGCQRAQTHSGTRLP